MGSGKLQDKRGQNEKLVDKTARSCRRGRRITVIARPGLVTPDKGPQGTWPITELERVQKGVAGVLKSKPTASVSCTWRADAPEPNTIAPVRTETSDGTVKYKIIARSNQPFLIPIILSPDFWPIDDRVEKEKEREGQKEKRGRREKGVQDRVTSTESDGIDTTKNTRMSI